MYRSPAGSVMRVGWLRSLLVLLLPVASACSDTSPTESVSEATSSDYVIVDVEPGGGSDPASAALRAARAGSAAAPAAAHNPPALGPHRAYYLEPGHFSGLQGVALKVRLRSPRGNGPWTWRIDWGDGMTTITRVDRNGEFVFLRTQPYRRPGNHTIAAIVADNRGVVSNVAFATVTIPGPELGTGDVRVTLTWDRFADIDLHVVDPLGERIAYVSRESASGGQLDFDDIVGFGPENIFWPTGEAPEGRYTVQVHYFSRGAGGGDGSPVNYTVEVLSGGATRTFHGTLGEVGAFQTVTEFDYPPTWEAAEAARTATATATGPVQSTAPELPRKDTR
jgi:hypothetical protein